MKKLLYIYVSIMSAVILCFSIAPDSQAKVELVASISPIRPDTIEFKITHISPNDNPIGNQIWSVAESETGWNFFAEESGITAQRGTHWISIKTEHATTIRSLALSNTGNGEILYFGEQGDFGSVTVDSLGKFQAKSLKYLLETPIEFGDVWNTYAIGQKIVFQTRKFIFVLENGKIDTITSENGFHNSFSENGRFLVREFGIGLKELTLENQLILVNGGDILAEEVLVGITPGLNSEILIWGQSGKRYIQQSADTKISIDKIYSSGLISLANQARFYVIEDIGNETYAIGTLGKGLIFVDQDTNIKFILDSTNGFTDQSVNYLQVSKNKGLWIALDNEGAMYADSDLLILSYAKNSGVSGYVNQATYLNGKLVLATGNGVYQSKTHFLNKKKNGHFHFTNSKINEFIQVYSDQAVWDITSFSGRNIIAAESGVFVLKENLSEDESWSSEECHNSDNIGNISTNAYTLYPIPENNMLLVGMKNGLGKISFNKDGSCEVVKMDAVGALEIRSIAHEGNNLWLGTAFNGVLRADLGKLLAGQTLSQTTKSTSHFPGRNDVVIWNSDVMIINKSGISKAEYNADKDQILSQVLDLGFAENQYKISGASEYSNGKAWIVTSENLLQVAKNSQFNRYEISSIPDALIFDKSSTSTIVEDANGVLWFNSGSTLFRYDVSYDISDHLLPSIYIHNVVRNNDGVVLFSGNYFDQNGFLLKSQAKENIPILNYEHKNISISLSSSDFVNPEAVQYRYMLEGSGRSWSEWNHESVKVFSTLKEGEYVFRAQAKDEVGRVSEDVVYAFVILPPWFRTPWAYLGYLIVILTAMISVQKYVVMRKAHKAAKEQAEELERNKEVVKKLQEANDRLLQANKLKDEFLATTSHELRTPLTAILGFTDVLKEEIPEDAEYREFLNIIEDSGLRLMDTLNSLLDLAKLRAGIVEITLEKVNLYEQSVGEVSKFEKMAAQKGIELRVVKPLSDLYVESDVHALGRIFHNLLNNALKFTESGSVEVSFETQSDKVLMHVTDTGIGIDQQFLPDLFNAFIQESDGLSRSHEGTGLGLAICAGLAILMNAGISVRSAKGQGSRFTVELPIFQEATSDDFETNELLEESTLDRAGDRPGRELERTDRGHRAWEVDELEDGHSVNEMEELRPEHPIREVEGFRDDRSGRDADRPASPGDRAGKVPGLKKGEPS